MNAPRSFRATELAKEFARKGHNVILYAVLGEYDYSSFEEQTGIEVRNLGPMTFAKLNSDGINERNLIGKVGSHLFGKLLEFPDIEMSFRIKNVLNEIKAIDLLISVAVPHPIHWGVALNRSLLAKDCIWVADCGDPYMGNHLNYHPWYFRFVENWTFKKADFITIPIMSAREAYDSQIQDKIKVIPQGFKFGKIEARVVDRLNTIPTFIYAGVFYENVRDPRPFLDYLSTVKKDFKFLVYTKNREILQPYKNTLGYKIEIHNYIPREELITLMSKMDFLVNFENGTSVQSPSKLIDYAIAGRPILSIGQGDVNVSLINEFLNFEFANEFVIPDVERFRIENIADKFLALCPK